jgi:TetR/AcrR family transcriptional regulator
VIYLLLGFAGRNPGITRVLLGDALVGETERLLARADQFFARIETQLKQILREAGLRQDVVGLCPADAAANLMLAWVEGRMHQYLRSRFRLSPLHQWEQQWQALEGGLFAEQSTSDPDA